jgi:hypothetical protein
VLTALNTLPVTDQERHYYQTRVRRPGLLGYFPVEWDRYQALARMAGRPSTPRGFIQYLRLSWRLGHPVQIPGRMLQKAWKRLTGRARSTQTRIPS